MNKLLTKIVGAALGLSMTVGVGVAVASNANKGLEPAKAAAGNVTYLHAMSAKPSTGDNTLSTVTWTVSGTNIGSMNTANYAGVQFGTSSKSGSITFTSKNSWGEQSTATSYFGKTKVTEVRVWLNAGSGTPTATVSIGGKNATSDGATVSKNTSASSYADTSCVTFTPASDGNSGVVVITASTSSKAGYFCAIEVDCEEPPASSKTLTSLSVSGSMTKTTYTTDESWDPAGLTVTATYDDSTSAAVTGSATWTYSPATPNATNITSVTATASYTEGGVTKTANSTAQSVTVTDKGTSSNPYTVSEAWAICDALSNGGNNGKVVHVTGVVSGTVSVSSGRGTFDITDGTKTLKAYSITGVNNSDSSNPAYVGDGYTVVITGAIIKYNANTYEVGYASGFSTSLVSSVAPKTISSIAVKTAPTKTAYKSGEAFDATGLVITVTYSDTSTEDVAYADHSASFSFSPATITAAGNVTITYREKTCTQAVTLITVTNVTGVASAPSQVYQNESIAVADVTLNVTYSDSSVGTVHPDTVSCDTSSLGAATATATYNAATGTKSATFEVTVKKAPVYDTIVDELTVADTGISGTTYGNWSGVEKGSGAVYAGSTNENSNGGIGMRQDTSKDPSGIIVTASAGVATKVEVAWTTTTSRTVHIKGQNTAYSSIEYASDVTGTEVGTIAYDSTVANLSAEYKYICIYVTGGAAGLSSIKITWKVEGAADPLTANPTLSTGAAASVSVGKTIALTVTTTPVDSDERLIVSSSDETKVTVSGSEKSYVIHGVALGFATITVAGAKGVYSSSTTITVTEAAKSFEDKVINPAAINVTGASYADNDAASHEHDGVSYATHQVQMQSGAFQFKKSVGYIQNSEPLYSPNSVDAKIKSITLFIHSENQGTVTVYEGTSEGPSTSVSASCTTGNVVTYTFSSNMTYFKIAETGGSHALSIDKFVIELDDSSYSVLAEARGVASAILTALKDVCGGDDHSGVVTQSQWDSLNAQITTLNPSANAKLLLKNAERLCLDNLSQGGAEIENAMAHYDACVTKFGYTPYSGITNATPSQSNSAINIINNNASTAAIISIVVVVSLSAVAGYFMLRKRKEQ